MWWQQATCEPGGKQGEEEEHVSFSFPFSLPSSSRIISANQGKCKFTKKHLFLENFTSYTFFSPCVPWLGDSPHHFGCELGCLSPVLGKGCELLVNLAGGEGHLVLWGSPSPSYGEHSPSKVVKIHPPLPGLWRVSNSGLQLKVCSGFPFPCSSFYSTFPSHFTFFFSLLFHKKTQPDP